MSDLRFLLIGLLLAVCLSGPVIAEEVILQCDAGDGALQAGWTQVVAGLNTNVAGTGINVTLATGESGAIEGRNTGGSGPLTDVETDFYFANDQTSSPGSDFILTLANLTPGLLYRLLSYHNRSDEGDTTIPGVTVTGATVVSAPSTILQSHAIMDDPAEFIFLATSSTVSIRYRGPDGGCGGCQAFFNGFVLARGYATLTFASSSSGALEMVSPALITVNLNDAEAGQTYTVDYAVTGGTATGAGVDYNLVEPNTLTFTPGETSKIISITIKDDGIPEPDETIIVELSNPTGQNVGLGEITEHTYTIIDPQPKVAFDFAGSSGEETTTPARINVSLSAASTEPVSVDFALTGGTATNDVDYFVLGSCLCDFDSSGIFDFLDYADLAYYWLSETPGCMADVTGDGTVDGNDLQNCIFDWLNNCGSQTLTFEPGQTTRSIYISVIDDGVEETDETIELDLSNPVNANIGAVPQHTYTIRGTALHLKVDLGLPVCGGTDPVPGTVKPGWWGFVAPRWADMYMHDAVWERGEDAQGGQSPPTDGIDGSGVHVALDISNGNGGFHNYRMCRDNLGGDGCPTGSPEGDPIANGWYHNIDWGGECTGDIHMRINDLSPGRYELTSYHNHWEPRTQSTRNCLEEPSNMPPMEHVFAMSVPVEGTMTCEYVLGWGTGSGVVSITEAYDIQVTSTTVFEEVATSVIVFETDGSDVVVIYDGGDNTYPDPARPDREGHKAILNAFEIRRIAEP